MTTPQKIFLLAFASIAIAFAFLFSSESWSQTCNPSTNQAAFFVDANFRGKCVVKGTGDYPNAGAIGLPNDSISSVKVGNNAQVVLCKDNDFKGDCIVLRTSTTFLNDRRIGNDQVSSAKVQRAGMTECEPGNGQAAFFINADFVAPCVVKGIGDYPNAAAIGLPNDSISAVKVGSNARVLLCKDNDFKGDCIFLNTSSNFLRDWNDQVSSVKIQNPSDKAPFDLTWSAVDGNGLPLNPRWAKQDDPRSPGLPGQALCHHPWEAPCTTQTPKIMDLPWPGEPLHPYNYACTVAGPLGRHVNWHIVTYEGSAKWDSWSSVSSDGIRADDDYNINVWRQDQSAYTQENPNFIHTEFDSDETIDHFTTSWWQQFHDAVKAGSGDSFIDGKEIIEIGMLGLDCAHSCGSEIHPVLALAIHVKDDPDDDQWAIFARNTGNEGFCSHDSIMAPELSTLLLTLPFRPGATGASVTVETNFQKTHDEIRMTTFPLMQGSRSGFVLQVELGDPARAPMINGVLHLKWTMGTGVAARAPSKPPAVFEEMRSRGLLSGEQSKTPEPEERFMKMVAKLPAATRQQLAKSHVNRPKPTWIPLQLVNLTAPPTGFRSRAMARPSPPGGLGALSRMTVVPDQRKLDNYKNAGEIMRQGGWTPSP